MFSPGLKRIIILQMQRFLDFETFSFTLNGEIIEGPRVEVLEIRHLEVSDRHFINEPPRGKTNNVVSEQVPATQTGLYKHRKELEA